MVGAAISLEAAGIAAGIVASLATVIGLAITMWDRHGKKGEGERTQIQNIYVTQDGPKLSTPGREVEAKRGPAQEATEDVRYALLLEACLWLASDLYMVGPTLEEKHRSLDLVERFIPELEHDLTRFSTKLDAASSETSQLIGDFLAGTFKQYLQAMRSNTSWLERRSDGEREPEEVERERKALHFDFSGGRQEISDRLRANRDYLAALAEQKKNGPWEVLGFTSPEAYAEYLRPTMRSLNSSPGDLGEDLLERLLDAPIPLRDLEEENLPQSIRVELINRLLADAWAELTSDGNIALTEAGERLVKKRLATWQGPAQGSASISR